MKDWYARQIAAEKSKKCSRNKSNRILVWIALVQQRPTICRGRRTRYIAKKKISPKWQFPQRITKYFGIWSTDRSPGRASSSELFSCFGCYASASTTTDSLHLPRLWHCVCVARTLSSPFDYTFEFGYCFALITCVESWLRWVSVVCFSFRLRSPPSQSSQNL